MNKDTKYIRAAVIGFVFIMGLLIAGAVGACEVGDIEPLGMLIYSFWFMTMIHAAVKLYSYCNYVDRERKKKREGAIYGRA